MVRAHQLGDAGEPVVWWTWDEIKALRDSTDREINAVATAVTAQWASGQISSAVRAPWKAFYDDWIKFRNGISAVTNFLVADSVTTLKKFREQGREWAAKFASAGITPAAPIPKPASQGGPSAGIDWATYIRWGLVVAGLAATAKIVSVFR